MDFDHNSELIILTEDESQAIRLPNYRDWPLSSARRLLEITETELSRVNDIDPSVTPFVAERYRLMSEKQRTGQLLRTMLVQLSPYASDGVADEASQFLRDQEN